MPELRKDPIIGRWVIISNERAKRPQDFIVKEEIPRATMCPFCKGNEGSTPPEIMAYRDDHSKPNTPGWSLRVVPNKFPALKIEGGLNREGRGVYDMMNGVGAHEVIIECPEHRLNFSELSEKSIENVLWSYRDRIIDLQKDQRFKYILIFKNAGAAAGASLEHTHSQLIALPIVPINVKREIDGSKKYYQYKERCIFCDILRQEIDLGDRIVSENADFLAFAPFAPRFPFETWLLPKSHQSSYQNTQKTEFESLAKILSDVLKRQDIALNHPPYNFILHSSPFTDSKNDYYHWHIELIPKLTKVAGFEWGTGFYINPTPPEDAAKFLRELEVK
jgi:UDPglucose--hexose-1-phosphate uridylyltransferase